MRSRQTGTIGEQRRFRAGWKHPSEVKGAPEHERRRCKDCAHCANEAREAECRQVRGEPFATLALATCGQFAPGGVDGLSV